MSRSISFSELLSMAYQRFPLSFQDDLAVAVRCRSGLYEAYVIELISSGSKVLSYTTGKPTIEAALNILGEILDF